MNTNDIPNAHPELLDALHRQDEQARQMRLSEGFTQKVMADLPLTAKSFSLRYLRHIAAIFLAAAFLGCMAWAISPLISSHKDKESKQQQVAPPLPDRGGVGAFVRFSNVCLDSILNVVAAHYGKTLCFRDTATQSLRLSTLWDCEDSLAVFIATLNEFDGLLLKEERDTLFVETHPSPSLVGRE